MVLFVTSISGGGLGILIGFLYWNMATGINSFVLVWSIVLVVFVVVMFIGIFIGGRARIKNERIMIQKKMNE